MVKFSIYLNRPVFVTCISPFTHKKATTTNEDRADKRRGTAIGIPAVHCNRNSRSRHFQQPMIAQLIELYLLDWNNFLFVNPVMVRCAKRSDIFALVSSTTGYGVLSLVLRTSNLTHILNQFQKPTLKQQKLRKHRLTEKRKLSGQRLKVR